MKYSKSKIEIYLKGLDRLFKKTGLTMADELGCKDLYYTPLRPYPLILFNLKALKHVALYKNKAYSLNKGVLREIQQ